MVFSWVYGLCFLVEGLGFMVFSQGFRVYVFLAEGLGFIWFREFRVYSFMVEGSVSSFPMTSIKCQALVFAHFSFSPKLCKE